MTLRCLMPPDILRPHSRATSALCVHQELPVRRSQRFGQVSFRIPQFFSKMPSVSDCKTSLPRCLSISSSGCKDKPSSGGLSSPKSKAEPTVC